MVEQYGASYRRGIRRADDDRDSRLQAGACSFFARYAGLNQLQKIKIFQNPLDRLLQPVDTITA